MKTKAIYLLLVAGLCMGACSPREDWLQTGDLIFVGIPADYDLDSDSMDSAITAATGGQTGINLIHTAIAEVDGEGRTWIIDATIKHGVDRHPLDTFLTDFTLKDGSLPVFEIMRLKDDSPAEASVERAKQYLGLPYDVYFLPDNGAMYCTELVQESYLTPDGEPIFHTTPMNFLNPDGEMPVYWEQLFARLGEPVPQGVPGTNPQGMSKEPALRQVNVRLR